MLVFAIAPIAPQARQQTSRAPAPAWIGEAFSTPEKTLTISRSGGKDVVLHELVHTIQDGGARELRLVWVVLPKNSFTFTVKRIDKIGPADELYSQVSNRPSIVINGGFYTMQNGRSAPLGLLIEDGKKLSSMADFNSGGIAFAGPDLPLVIKPIRQFVPNARIAQAVQAKPILIEKGAISVKSNPLDRPFDRTAIGLTATGDLVIAGAYRDDTQAVTLLDFARFLQLLRTRKNVLFDTVLNLDGATDAHLFIPTTKQHFGYGGTNYVPDVLVIGIK